MDKPSIFLAGAARGIITPPLGTPLYGYPTHRPAARVNDDLTATALVISDGNVRACVVSLTICSIPQSLCQRLEALIRPQTGIDHFIFGTTHTHSGPATVTTAGWGEQDTAYIDDILVPKVVEVVCEANACLVPAILGVGQTHSDVGVNRRSIRPDGSVGLGINPWGIFDPRMTVVSILAQSDRTPIATMVHYGAHGTAAGGAHTCDITRDWSGVMTDRLEALTDAPCLFLLGAEGDVAPRAPGPRYFRDGTQVLDRIDQAMDLGGKAACDAARAWESIDRWEIPALSVRTGEVALSYEPPCSAEEAKTALAALEERTDNMALYEKRHWEQVLAHEGQEPEDALRYPQTVIILGDIALVPHPFEIFSSIALRLSDASPCRYTLSMANANGTNGYLPAKEDILRGGYEIWSSRYRYSQVLTVDADTQLIQANLALLSN